jgi:hypothetical protein
MTVGVRLLTFGLVALLGAGVFVPSAALGSEPEVPFWTVAGSRLASGSKTAAIGNVAGVKATLRSHIETIEVEIRCEKETLGESVIEGSQVKQAGKASGTLELAGCKLFAKEGETFVEDAECEVVPIKSAPLSGALWLEGKKGEGATAVVVFESKTSPLAKIAINACAFEGAYSLTGSFAARLLPQNEEFEFIQWLLPETAVATVWRPPGEEGEKTVGLALEGNAATLQGEMKVELASHEVFGGGTEPVAAIEAPFWGLEHKRLNLGEEEGLKEAEGPRPPTAEAAKLAWKLKGTEVETRCGKVTVGEPKVEGSLNQHDGRFKAKAIKLAECTFFAKEKTEFVEQKTCEVPAFSTNRLSGKLWLAGFKQERGKKPVLVLGPETLTAGKSVLGTESIKNKGSEKCPFLEENYAIEGGLLTRLTPENAETKVLELSITESAAHVWQSAEQEAEKQVVLSHGSERIFINIPNIDLQPKSGQMLGGGSKGVGTAGPGPFWHHRVNSKEGIGSKIEANALENFQGEGGEQKLRAKVAETSIEIVSSHVQIKGAVYNNALQGQAKLELVYTEPKIIKPALKECSVVLGENNSVRLKGHLMWKWNGLAKQLVEGAPTAQKPDLVFTPTEIATGATALPKGELTKIVTKGSGCGILAGTFKVEGSETDLPSSPNLEEWSSTLSTRTTEAGEMLQHFWNGGEFIGAKAGMIFAGNQASMIGQTTMKAGQEVAIFENK